VLALPRLYDFVFYGAMPDLVATAGFAVLLAGCLLGRTCACHAATGSACGIAPTSSRRAASRWCCSFLLEWKVFG
jgi:hypothetical protein